VNTNEAVLLLDMWKNQYEKLDNVQRELARLTGINSESPITKPMWMIWESYTDVLSRLLGDEEDWLYWFVYENDMGKKGLKVQSIADSKPKEVKTLLHLVELITITSNVDVAAKAEGKSTESFLTDSRRRIKEKKVFPPEKYKTQFERTFKGLTFENFFTIKKGLDLEAFAIAIRVPQESPSVVQWVSCHYGKQAEKMIQAILLSSNKKD